MSAGGLLYSIKDINLVVNYLGEPLNFIGLYYSNYWESRIFWDHHPKMKGVRILSRVELYHFISLSNHIYQYTSY